MWKNPVSLSPNKKQLSTNRSNCGRPLESASEVLAIRWEKTEIINRREGRQLHFACSIPSLEPGLLGAKKELPGQKEFVLPGKEKQGEQASSQPLGALHEDLTLVSPYQTNKTKMCRARKKEEKQKLLLADTQQELLQFTETCIKS